MKLVVEEFEMKETVKILLEIAQKSAESGDYEAALKFAEAAEKAAGAMNLIACAEQCARY